MKLNFSKNSGNFELVIWTIYYLLMFTIGRYPLFKQAVIWGGGGLAFALTTRFIYYNFKQIPKESILLLALWFWSLTGGLLAIDMHGYSEYLRLLGQLVLIVIFLGTIYKKSTDNTLFLLAIIIPPLFMLGDLLWGRSSPDVVAMALESATTERASGLANDPNFFGMFCCMGSWAALATMSHSKKRIFDIILIVYLGVMFYGILIAASRSAFLVYALIIAGWVILCLPQKVPLTGLRLVLLAAFIVLALFVTEWIFNNTFLGSRSTQAFENADEQNRVRLLLFGLELFLESPIIGHGLAQFVVLEPTGHYSHNDFIELLATTGLFGTILYLAVFISIFIKLYRAAKYFKKSEIHNEIMLYLIALVFLLASGTFNVNFASMDRAFFMAILIGMAGKFDKLRQETISRG